MTLLWSCGEKQSPPPEVESTTPAQKDHPRLLIDNATQRPESPTGITATAEDNSITISWDKIDNAQQYTIYVAAEPGVLPDNYWTLKKGTTYVTTELSFVSTDLENGESYYFVITASNSKGESLPSNQISATPKPISKDSEALSAPKAPTNVITRAGNHEVTLSWDEVEGAEQYNVYLATEFGVNQHLYSKLQNGMAVLNVSNPYTLQGLKNNTIYYFVVTAANRNGESNASAEAYATPFLAQPAPTVPRRVRAIAGDGEITLRWKTSATATQHHVYRATEAGIEPSKLTESNNIKTFKNVNSPFVQRELVNGQNYYFVVTAENDGGESAMSAEVKATPRVKASAPQAPAKILVTQIDKQYVISWSAVPEATHYHLYLASQTGVNSQNYNTLDNGTIYREVNSPHTLNDLPNNTTFYAVVAALNAVGESPVSIETSFSTPSVAEAPSAVAPLKKRRSAKYLVLDNNGNAYKDQSLTYEQRPWSCVKSIATGLVWEVKSNDIGLHNVNNTYTWYNPNQSAQPQISGTSNGGICKGSECDTHAYVAAVNASKLCGFDDWRLPTRAELTGLIENNVIYPDATIDGESFPNTAKSFHWSSTSYSHNPELAWFVYFGSGYDYYEYKSFASHVRLVRGQTQ